MPLGISVLLRAEHDDYPNALFPYDHRNGAVRSNPFCDVVLFDLEFNFSFQVPPDDGSSVFKHPPMMAFLAVEPYADAIEAIGATTIVSD